MNSVDDDYENGKLRGPAGGRVKPRLAWAGGEPVPSPIAAIDVASSPESFRGRPAPDETHPRYIRDIWSAPTPGGLQQGDYVLATKYRDGDPADHFVVGFYDRSFNAGVETRHMIVDSEGKQFRANGFRRVAKLGTKRGAWIVGHLTLIERERDRFSVWHWYRAPWRELQELHCDHADS